MSVFKRWCLPRDPSSSFLFFHYQFSEAPTRNELVRPSTGLRCLNPFPSLFPLSHTLSLISWLRCWQWALAAGNIVIVRSTPGNSYRLVGLTRCVDGPNFDSRWLHDWSVRSAAVSPVRRSFHVSLGRVEAIQLSEGVEPPRRYTTRMGQLRLCVCAACDVKRIISDGNRAVPVSAENVTARRGPILVIATPHWSRCLQVSLNQIHVCVCVCVWVGLLLGSLLAMCVRECVSVIAVRRWRAFSRSPSLDEKGFYPST